MSACASWIAANRETIFKYLNRKSLTKYEKEEVYQDLVIKALVSGKNVENPLRWSIRVCKNLIVDIKTESKKLSRNPSIESFEIVCHDSPDKILMAREFASKLNDEIQAMTRKQREAILHRMEFDKRATDCSKELGLNHDSFKANLKLGREVLKLFLNAHYDRMNEKTQNSIIFMKSIYD